KKYLFKPITNFLSSRIFYCICGVVALAFSGFFHNEMILVNNSGAFLFWFLLGKILGDFDEGNKIEDKRE
ncbi:O-antigen ligase domain-containing protein, partial [Enterococcus faecalis]